MHTYSPRPGPSGGERSRRTIAPQPLGSRISGEQVPRKTKQRPDKLPESRMYVADIKAELKKLGVTAPLVLMQKKLILAKLLAEMRVRAQIPPPDCLEKKQEQQEDITNYNGAQRKKSRKRTAVLYAELDCSDDDGWESSNTAMDAWSDSEEDECLFPYDWTSQENLIDAEDPLILGWPGERPTWSYGVAQESFGYIEEEEEDEEEEEEEKEEKEEEEEGKTPQLRVHHYSFDAESQTLMPSWMTPKDLTAYLAAEDAKAPKEMLAETQPTGHVAYITAVDAEDILLAGPKTAELDAETGFLSPLQHASVCRMMYSS